MLQNLWKIICAIISKLTKRQMQTNQSWCLLLFPLDLWLDKRFLRFTIFSFISTFCITCFGAQALVTCLCLLDEKMQEPILLSFQKVKVKLAQQVLIQIFLGKIRTPPGHDLPPQLISFHPSSPDDLCSSNPPRLLLAFTVLGNAKSQTWKYFKLIKEKVIIGG